MVLQKTCCGKAYNINDLNNNMNVLSQSDNSLADVGIE